MDCTNRCTEQWNLQLDKLVDAYLEYCLHADEDQRAQVQADEEHIDILHVETVDIFRMFFTRNQYAQGISLPEKVVQHLVSVFHLRINIQTSSWFDTATLGPPLYTQLLLFHYAH